MYNGIKMLIICYSPPQLYFQVGLNACVFFTFFNFLFHPLPCRKRSSASEKKAIDFRFLFESQFGHADLLSR